MAGVQGTSCKLCLETVTVNGLEVIDNVTRDTLDVLLLKLIFDSEGKEVICNVCRRKLNAAFEFKSTCLKTDNTIIPYVDCEKMLQLDIRDVYTKEKTSESMDISDSQKICRLCMHPVESKFRCIREEELEAIEKLVPEMNINIIKDPVVCKECFDSVCTHNSFLKNCWEVQEEIRGTFNSAATESQMDTSPSDLFVKTENQDKEFDINEMEMSIKAESIDIKLEDEEISDSLLQSSESGSFEKSVLRDEEEDEYKHENKSTNECNTKVKQDDNVFYIGSYDYKTRHRCELAKSQVKHKSASGGRLYECDICDFKTKRKFNFDRHYIKHKNSNNGVECDFKTIYTALQNKDTLQLPIYKCDGCTYESKNKRNFTRHQLVHKDPSQFKMYGCNDCDFKTKYKDAMKLHQLKHKDLSQVQTYKCDVCDLETKYKGDMKKHQLKHKDPSLVQTYRCNDCDFETKYKSSIKKHQLKHKDPSQVQMYRCIYCDHESKYKTNIILHQLKHKDPSQVQMYRCKDCNYETKFKSDMTQHQLKHKDPLQVQTYRCNECDYETIYKKYIKRHQLKHKDPSQVHIYRCNDCNYKTIYKGEMKKHQLTHKDRSQVQTYRCNDCDYETKYKSCIKSHQLKHKDLSQVQLYRCNDCDFETKYKSYIKRHQLKHKEEVVPTVIINSNAGVV